MMKRFNPAILFALTLVPLWNGLAFASKEVTRIPFEECVDIMQKMASGLGVTPINVVNTSIMKMVRIPTADGEITVSCVKPTQKMTVIKKITPTQSK